MELRPYQNKAITETRKFLSKNDKALIVAGTGSGKSVINAELIYLSAKNNKKVLQLVHTKELVEQNSKEFAKLCELRNVSFDFSICCAGLGKPTTDKDIVFASPQTFINRMDGLDNYDLIIIDECIHKDELIKIKGGYKKIKDITVNDKVACYNEKEKKIMYDNPLQVVSSGLKSITRVKHKYGELKCTNTHKIYTAGSWVQAQEIRKGQIIMLEDLQTSVLIKLLRASVAVAKELILMLKKEN